MVYRVEADEAKTEGAQFSEQSSVTGNQQIVIPNPFMGEIICRPSEKVL